jgi:hypothetical protein
MLVQEIGIPPERVIMSDEVLAKRVTVAQKMAHLFVDPEFSKRFLGNASANNDGMIAIMPADADEPAGTSLRRMEISKDSSRFILASFVNDEIIYAEFATVATIDAQTESISLEGLTTGEWLEAVLSGRGNIAKVFTTDRAAGYVEEVFS